MDRTAIPSGKPCVSPFLPVFLLGVTMIWLQADHISLSGPDGTAWAAVAKELSGKPLSQWIVLTLQGTPIYWHPPLMFWMMALCLKLFSGGTLAVLLPSLVLSTLTIVVLYQMGEILWDRPYALCCAIALIFTPQFLRTGRSTMLEPGLMFFIYLALLFHLRFLRDGSFRWSLGCGVGLASAFLAKGMPALLILGIIPAYEIARRIMGKKTATVAALGVHLLIVVGIWAIALAGVEVWYRAVTALGFWGQYLHGQVLPGILSGGAPRFHGDYFFYVRELGRTFWPVLPFAVAGIALAVRRRSVESIPAISLALLALGGVVGGFSFSALKTPWYGNINSAALALLSGAAIRLFLSRNTIDEKLPRFSAGLLAILLFSCSVFPSLFRYHRYAEEFFDSASHALGSRLAGRSLSDCAELHPWSGPPLVQFYLGARWVNCDWSAPLVLAKPEGMSFRSGDRVIFAGSKFLIVERGK